MSFARLAVTVLFAAACAGAASANDARSKSTPCAAIASIVVARMAPNGVVTLQLRSFWPDPIGEGELTYALDDPQYGTVKQHLGGTAPGESKPVPPWC